MDWFSLTLADGEAAPESHESLAEVTLLCRWCITRWSLDTSSLTATLSPRSPEFQQGPSLRHPPQLWWGHMARPLVLGSCLPHGVLSSSLLIPSGPSATGSSPGLRPPLQPWPCWHARARLGTGWLSSGQLLTICFHSAHCLPPLPSCADVLKGVRGKVFFFVVPGVKPRALAVLVRQLHDELHPQPLDQY